MRRKILSVFCVVLVMCMVVGLIGGCTKTDSPSQADLPDPEGKEKDNGEEKQKSEPKDDSEDIKEEKITLRVYVLSNIEEFPSGQDENNNEIIEYLREKTGYDLKWEIQPREGAKEKINLLMTSGDTPDLIETADKSLFANLAQQEVLTSLEQILNEVGPDIKKLVPDDLWKSVTFDDEIYAVPVPQNQMANNGVFVRKDWLDKLGLEEPKTIDEYYAAMKELKQADPGGNDTIPWVGGAGGGSAFSYIGSFAGAFGIGVSYKEKEGQVVYSHIEPEAKEFLVFMNKLYEEGLLDSEYPVNKGDNVKEKMANGRGGMTSVAWFTAKEIVDATTEKDPNAEFKYIHPPVGENGEFGEAKYSPVRVYLFVPKFSKHPKETIDFLNKYVDPEVSDIVSYGWEGKHYNRKDDLIEPTPEAEEIRYRIYYTLWDTQENFDNRVKLKGFWPYYEPIMEYCVLEDVYGYAPPIEVVEENSSILNDLMNEYFIKIITGAIPIDKFDEFVEKWKSSGGDESLKAINEWYSTTK